MFRHLEELSRNAWPGSRVVEFDGWVLQFAGGYTRRANSVNLAGTSIIAVEDKVQVCEDAYRLEDQPTIFKIFPDPETEALDVYLEARGYRSEGHAYVMTQAIEPMELTDSCHVQVETELTDWWLDAAVQLNQISGTNRLHLANILRNINPTQAFASIRHENEPVAVGLGVLDNGWCGLYDIVTSERHRRLGHGKVLVQSMIEWARQQGAHHAYLQVMTQNHPAQQLYRSLGFEQEYEYWYRVSPPTISEV